MSEDPDGWLPLTPLSPSARIRDGIAVSLPALGLCVYGFTFGWAAADALRSPGFVHIALGLSFAAVPLLGAAWIWTLLNPVPFVDFARNRLRIRARTIDLAEVDVARFLGHVTGSSEALTRDIDPAHRLRGLRIGAQNGPQVSILLPRGEGGAVESEYRDRLVEVIRRSNIDYPASSYDPKRKFAKYNFPENLDKAAALSFILDTPDDAGAAQPKP